MVQEGIVGLRWTVTELQGNSRTIDGASPASNSVFTVLNLVVGRGICHVRNWLNLPR